MIRIKDKNQLELPGLESWRLQYSPSKLSKLTNSWAEIFRTYVLPILPVNKIKKYYDTSTGRPSKELYSIMGVTILQQFFNLTDEETVDEFAFNQQWHFALECFDERDQVISLKTLWTMRNRMILENIGGEVFDKSLNVLIDQFKVKTEKQRLDSVHVYSNMAKLGRVRILAKTTELFLKHLKKSFNDVFESTIPQEIKDLYFKGKGVSIFGQVKPSESEKTLQKLSEEMNILLLMFAKNNEITSLKSFKLLERVFSEHCDVKESRVIVKKSKEIDSSSIQNPSDPSAGYDGYKGQGYQTQIVETYSETKEENDLNLITHVFTESAAIHDSHALAPAIKDLKEKEICPEILLCDAAYGSEKNINMGKEHNIEVISPVPGNTSKRGLEGFLFEKDTLKISVCPEGHKPNQSKIGKNDRYCVKWDNTVCNKCPNIDNCPARKGLNNRILYYRKTEAVSIMRRVYEQSDEFHNKYRYRSGIEGTNSRFINQTEARRSRYRGLEKMLYSQTLKALYINIFRVAKSKKWKELLLILFIFMGKQRFEALKNRKLFENVSNLSLCS